MSFTRFHDDPYRIKKQLEETTYTGRYMLNTPGQGTDLPFMQDPQLRLQKWGANLRDNAINLESDLRGLTRPLNRDLVNQNNYQLQSASSSTMNYKDTAPIVDESRATHPASCRLPASGPLPRQAPTLPLCWRGTAGRLVACQCNREGALHTLHAWPAAWDQPTRRPC